MPLMVRAINTHSNKSHTVVLNMKVTADENLLMKSLFNASQSLQYALSTAQQFDSMGKVVQINFIASILSLIIFLTQLFLD